ncbi:transcription termination factor MTERF5, chloroplastic isoform X2 [Malania oleifera]|uniref:transcription termination factor MTERF5, chloroplastic isoform X2 n=1 Tax=Malania oleifera TaxID=397392 RepID=UPI0025AE6116|nr:transcription termination factor MTERF5, chloroplastic isoform X2 [Malania oleifera]
MTSILPTSTSNSTVFSSANPIQCLYFPSDLPFRRKLFPPPVSCPIFLRRIIFPKNPPRLHSSTVHNATTSSPDDDDSHIEEALDAVSMILQESGLSKQASIEIASKCPKYVKMLMDSVHDLDELSLWSPWRSKGETKEEEESDGLLSFRKKVYYMAKEKGDKGVLPYLESIGLSLSSSMHVARYISSETLPSLICKVNYMKEIFFSGSDDGGFIGRNARCMMMHLSIPIDEDVQQTLSFFEKMEARRGGLDMLVSEDATFRYLIESFPRLLKLSLESHMKPMVEFLENIGVCRGSMRNVGAVNKDLGRMLVKYPWIISTSIQENYEEILAFFDVQKVPKVSVSRAIKSWPLFLGSSTSKLNLMLEQFAELGIRNKMGQVIATSPQLLLRKPHEFLKVVSFMEDLGLDRETVGRILGRCPEIFATNIEKTLRKKLEFLTRIGVSEDHFPRVIRKYPELFVSDVDRSLHPRMNYLLEAGLSKRDIAFMVRRFSPLLGYSIDEVFRPKLEFLVNTMEKPVRELVDYPRYFSYSLEKKIMPRFWVLKGRNIDCSLKEMLSKNDEEFAAEFMGVGRMLVPPA